MDTREKKNQSKNDSDQFKEIEKLFLDEEIPVIERIEAFPKYASRQSIAKFITKYEIFRKTLNVSGSIIECGVLHGGGLLAWAKLSAIFEPANHVRKIIGFDTFEGFPSIAPEDTETGNFYNMKSGALAGAKIDSVRKAIDVFDLNRPISHINKVELVQGDLCKTAQQYVDNNPHLVVSILNLDVDLYEPTKKALEVFVPRMPKGAIVVFDQFNAKIFPGETIAAMEHFGIRNLRIERFHYDSYVSYAVLE